jgi:hypothetical protein
VLTEVHVLGLSFFFSVQDTNALVFRALLAALGLSADQDYDMNRCAKRPAAGASCACIFILVPDSCTWNWYLLVVPAWCWLQPWDGTDWLLLGCAALRCDWLCCSVAVPRKAKEAIGAIARLTASDGSGKAMTVSQHCKQQTQGRLLSFRGGSSGTSWWQ